MKSKIILVPLLLFISIFQLLAQIGNQFSREQISSDLNYLTKTLEEAHYDLYAYTSKREFEANIQLVKDQINQDSLSLLEVITLLQQVISKANTGHAEIDFPAASYIAYAQNGGTIFPLEIAIEDEKYYIRKSFSGRVDIKAGSEINSINGRSIDELLEGIYPQLSAENTYFKNAKVELWSFPRLYWQMFGEQKSFEVTLSESGKKRTLNIKAIEAIADYEVKRKDILSSEMSVLVNDRYAYLNPGNFSGDEDLYKNFIDSAFAVIVESENKNLIVDLRNNAGGDNSFSDYLVSYFADQPFQWYSKFTLKSSEILKTQTRFNNDTTEIYFRSILDHKNGEVYEYDFNPQIPQPAKKRFEGSIYVLINRHSYSQSAVTAAMIQDYKFGIIVGEETGDFPTLHAAQFQFSLPETSAIVKVPKGYIVRVNGTEKRSGVIPNIKIRDHLIDETDEILEGLLKRLE